MFKNGKYLFAFILLISGCVKTIESNSISLDSKCKINPNFNNSFAKAVDYAFSCGKKSEAFTMLSKLNANNDGELNTELGHILFNYGYTDIAIEYFNKAIKVNYPIAYYGLAMIYTESKKHKDIDKTVSLLKTSLDMGYTEAYYNLGIIYLDEIKYKNLDKATYYFENALKSGNAKAFYGLGEVNLENKDFKNAKINFNKAIEYEIYLDGYQGLMFLYGFYPEYSEHDLDKSFYYMTKTLELSDDEFTYESASEFYKLKGKYYNQEKSKYYMNLAKLKAKK